MTQPDLFGGKSGKPARPRAEPEKLKPLDVAIRSAVAAAILTYAESDFDAIRASDLRGRELEGVSVAERERHMLSLKILVLPTSTFMNGERMWRVL